MRRKPKILILAGSVRTGSYSQQLADAYAAELTNHECDITRVTLKDYELPFILEPAGSDKDLPENGIKLAKQFNAHDGIVMVTPEYNGSLPPLLKNAIDWISVTKGDASNPIVPFRGKVCAIAASSPGKMGGIAAIGHLREILVRLGMLVISEQLAVGGSGDAFDDKGRLKEGRTVSMLTDACKSLVEKASLLS